MQDTAIRTVLFLCTGNYYRSRTAEAVFNHRAARTALPWRAASRGLRLNDGNKGPISKFAASWLDAQAVPYETRDPIDLSVHDLIRAGRIIAVDETEHRALMRARFPDWENRVEYWTVHDIDRTAPDDALSAIEDRVLELVNALGPAKSGVES